MDQIDQGGWTAAPLTATQRHMWLQEQLAPSSIVNHIGYALRVVDELDVDLLQAAVDHVVASHELLRAAVVDVDGEPELRIRHALQVRVDHRRATASPTGTDEQVAHERISAPYDLEHGPLFRVGVVSRSSVDHLLTVGAHHVISDMWSLALVLASIDDAYRRLRDGEPTVAPRLRSSFTEHAVAEQAFLASPAAEQLLDFWRDELRGIPTTIDLPLDHPTGSIDGGEGGVVSFDIGPDRTERVHALARAASASPFAVMLTVFGSVIARYSGSSDLPLVTTRANRTTRTARLVGCFVNPIPLRVRLTGGEAVEQGVREIEGQIDRSFRHALPIQHIAERLWAPQAERPNLRVGFTWQKTVRAVDARTATAIALGRAGVATRLAGFRAETIQFRHRPAPLPLTMLVAESEDGLHVALEYATDLFDATTIERLRDHVLTTLDAALDDPARAIDDLPVLTDREWTELRAEWALTTEMVPDDTPVHRRFRQRAELHPARVAVSCGDERATYGELAHRADALARRIIESEVRPGDRVGILLERSIDMVAAVIAVMQAGAAYVPLDADHPCERLVATATDAGCVAVVTDRDLPDGLETVTSIDLRVGGRSPSPSSSGPTEVHGELDDVAYLMYTSGSTGAPKGVVVAHRNVVHEVSAMTRLLRIDEHAVFLAQSSLSFDSITDIFVPLLVGARVEVAPQWVGRDGFELARVLRACGATFMDATPTTWRMLIESGWTGGPGFTVLCGGEAMPVELAHELRSRAGAVWNAYGPTETTVWSTFHRLDPSGTLDGPVPIGSPLPGNRIYVLDHRRRPVPDGTIGELHIAGNGVSAGYHGRPDLTAERFVPDPFHPGQRMFRTGDVASRTTASGEPARYHFHGRADDQIKLRGHRIEPGDVESVLDRHPGVASSVVTLHSPAGGDARLVAYVVGEPGKEPPSAPVLREWCRRALPAQMVPATVVPVERFPLTASGKVDRRRLPPPDPDCAVASEPAHPGLETDLAEIWTTVLGLDAIGRDDDFFQLGGHSLHATRIASRVRSQLHAHVGVRTVFEHPSVARLAEAVRRHTSVPLPVPSIADTDDDEGPMTYSQERMWLLHQLDPEGAAYNMSGAVRLRGRLDAEALAAAIDTVVRRHDSLRTVFAVHAGATPYQRIVDHEPIALQRRAVSAAPDTIDRLRSELTDEARRPFLLDRLPLVRFVLHDLGPDDHVLQATMHHIVSDEWSMGILAREIAAEYSAAQEGRRSPLQPATVREIDYARWHRDIVEQHLLDQQLDYWRRQLAGMRPLELPTDRPRPTILGSDGATVIAAIDEEVLASVRQFARDHHVSPFMVLLAAFQTLLARITASDDVAVGTAVANRHWLESEQLVASLVNTVVLRTPTPSGASFHEVLRAAQDTALDAYANQDIPFAHVVRQLETHRDRNRSALFQVFFNVLTAPLGVPHLDGLATEVIPIDRRAAQFDLSLTVDLAHHQAGIEYRSELFDRDRIERLLRMYWTVVGEAIGDPHRSIGELPLTTPAEGDALRATWSNPRPDVDMVTPVVRQFERIANSRPDHVAVRDRHTALTYEQLDRRADQIARSLIDAGAGAGSRVGLHLHRTVDMLAAVLAVHKAGAAYVPLDPAFPADRLAFMAADASIRMVITHRDLVGGIDVEREIVVDEIPAPTLPAGSSPIPLAPDDVAYVLYTSGSTGRPKGVQVTHGNLSNFISSMVEEPGIGEDDVLLAVTTLSFDIAGLELLGPLAAGGTVVIADRAATADPNELRRLLDDTGATILQATPATWRMLVESGWAGGDRLVALCGGEALTPALAHEIRSRCRRVWNMYGPTETTIWSMVNDITEPTRPAGQSDGSEAVSLGRPIANTWIHVLDPNGTPCPVGVPGELYIGGAGVAAGYLGRPDLTEQRFVPDPWVDGATMYRTGDLVCCTAAGEVDFLGRADDQVKIRGFRIELGEIESVLARHPAVGACAVAARERATGDTRLVAYITPADVGAPTLDELRRHASASLPDYMVPTALVVVDSFPLTPNNKLDRRALPDPAEPPAGESTAFEPPRPGTETVIGGIWCDVLGRTYVDRHDDFFALGGHSLLAIRVFADIEHRLGARLPISALFQSPTIEQLAAAVERGRPPQRWTSLVPVQPGGRLRPFFYVAPFLITSLSFANLARSLGSDQPFYVLQPQGMDTDDPVHDTVEAMATHYVRELRTVQPHGPYLIGGHCAGASVAFEMARQLQAAGEPIALLALVDAEPPHVTRPSVHPIVHVRRRLAHYARDRRLLAALRWYLHVVTERTIRRRFGTAEARRLADLRSRHAIAHGAYAPGSYDGGVLLIRSSEWNSDPTTAWHLRWSELVSGRLDVQEVAGTHAGLVQMESSIDLAHRLRRAITAASEPAR